MRIVAPANTVHYLANAKVQFHKMFLSNRYFYKLFMSFLDIQLYIFVHVIDNKLICASQKELEWGCPNGT